MHTDLDDAEMTDNAAHENIQGVVTNNSTKLEFINVRVYDFSPETTGEIPVRRYHIDTRVRL